MHRARYVGKAAQCHTNKLNLNRITFQLDNISTHPSPTKKKNAEEVLEKSYFCSSPD